MPFPSYFKLYYLLTYLLHGAESFLRSWPVFAASQEIPCIFMEPEISLPYSQVPATRPYLLKLRDTSSGTLPPPGEPNGGVVRFQISLSPEEASHLMSISEHDCFHGEGLL